MNKKNDNLAKTYREIGPYLGLGSQLAITVGVIGYIGYLLDEKFETSPIIFIVFLILGISAGMYNFIKSALNLSKKKEVE